MSEHGKFVGVTPFGQGVLPSEEDGLDVESSEEEYDPGVFTQSDPDPVQPDLVSDSAHPDIGSDVVQRCVIFWLINC